MDNHHVSYIIICLKSTALKLFENLKVFKFHYFNLKEAFALILFFWGGIPFFQNVTLQGFPFFQTPPKL